MAPETGCMIRKAEWGVARLQEGCSLSLSLNNHSQRGWHGPERMTMKSEYQTDGVPTCMMILGNFEHLREAKAKEMDPEPRLLGTPSKTR